MREVSSKSLRCAGFQADLGGDLLIDDLRYAISKPAAFDAVIRVRTSTGMIHCLHLLIIQVT